MALPVDSSLGGNGATLVVAGTLYSGFPGSRLQPGGMVVRGRSIVAIGEPEQLRSLHPDAAELDVGPIVLVPGFVDAHVHLAFDATPAAVEHLRGLDDNELAAAMVERAGMLVRSGVTTARDLGCRGLVAYALRRLIDRGLVEGPSLLCSGAPLTTPGGHAFWFGGEVAGESALRAAVRERGLAGADWLKVIVSGGFLTDGSDPAAAQFDAAELAALVEEARRASLPVAADVHATADIAAVLDAGVDTIEHCTFVGPERDAHLVEPLIERLSGSAVAVCPTLNAGTLDLPFPGGTASIERVRRLVRAGVRIVMGTDAGVPGAGHDQYAEGLLLLGAAGMTAPEALAAATSTAAEVLGVGQVTGRLAAGFRADVVGLEADPLDDLEAVRHVGFVMAAGRVQDQRAAVRRDGSA